MNKTAAIKTVGIIFGIFFVIVVFPIVSIICLVYFGTVMPLIVFGGAACLFAVIGICWTDIQDIYKYFSGDTK